MEQELSQPLDPEMLVQMQVEFQHDLRDVGRGSHHRRPHRRDLLGHSSTEESPRSARSIN